MTSLRISGMARSPPWLNPVFNQETTIGSRNEVAHLPDSAHGR